MRYYGRVKLSVMDLWRKVDGEGMKPMGNWLHLISIRSAEKPVTMLRLKDNIRFLGVFW